MASRSAQFSLSFFSLDSLSSWSALKVLNLSGNHLKSLTRGSQQSIRLTRLKVLDLSHNNLQVIHQKGEVSMSDDKLQEFSSPFSGFYLADKLCKYLLQKAAGRKGEREVVHPRKS